MVAQQVEHRSFFLLAERGGSDGAIDDAGIRKSGDVALVRSPRAV
jgi:hypothetical protein